MVLHAGGVGLSLIKVLATTAGIALIAGLGAGGLTTWAMSQVRTISGASQGSGSNASSGSNVFVSLEDGPAPSKVDLSTLKIVGMIDPATGNITEFATPRSVASLRQGVDPLP
jgi:hypothetical protein